MRKRPRLRTVLLAVNLAVLVLPLAGIAVLRIYENELQSNRWRFAMAISALCWPGQLTVPGARTC